MRRRGAGEQGSGIGETGPVLEVPLLEKLPFWVVTFLMKEKVIKFNTVCSAGTLNLQVQG